MTMTRETRIELRSSDEEKKEFEKAAALVHMGLSEFIRFSAHLYAKDVQEKQHTITLSKLDTERFLDALQTPPEPNENLNKAMADYANMRSQSNHFDC